MNSVLVSRGRMVEEVGVDELGLQHATEFSAYLAERLQLLPVEVPQPSDWSGSGNTLGSIGLRLGLLSLDEIDQIISRQCSDRRLFGEIGISLKILDEDQVRYLLVLQRFHRCLDLGAILVTEGRISFSELLDLMADYFRK